MAACVVWLCAAQFSYSGCSKSYQTPDFSTESREAIAESIENVRLSLNEALEWAPESICRIGRCEAGRAEECMGEARRAARIRFVWLSCLTDPAEGLAGGPVEAGAGQSSAGRSTEDQARLRVETINFVGCRPQQALSYLDMMASGSAADRAWLRGQLILVDEIRTRLRLEFPTRLAEFRRSVSELDVRIATLRARYQAEMGQLRSDGAPGEVIGTWEDRYQTAMTDLIALENGLASLRDAVDSSSNFARRRFAEAAARIAASGFEAWNTGNCEIAE